MNEEEKKAIEILEIEGTENNYWEVKIVLDLIDRLQKENEELKEMLKTRIRYTNELEQDLFENASNYVVSKDKIRNKIKELKEEQEEYKDSQEWEIQDSIQTQISLLESLLEGE